MTIIALCTDAYCLSNICKFSNLIETSLCDTTDESECKNLGKFGQKYIIREEYSPNRNPVRWEQGCQFSFHRRNSSLCWRFPSFDGPDFCINLSFFQPVVGLYSPNLHSYSFSFFWQNVTGMPGWELPADWFQKSLHYFFSQSGTL